MNTTHFPLRGAFVAVLFLAALPAGAVQPSSSTILPPVLIIEDTGINPYHIDFRLPPGLDATTIPGYYPNHATLVELTLDADTFAEAKALDREVWEGLEYGVLYAFNGTRIVGAMDYGNSAVYSEYPTLDSNGHGTLVASSAVGAKSGSCPDCRIVVLRDRHGLHWDWVLDQDWIDAFSVSRGSLAGVALPWNQFESGSKRWVESGRSVFTSAGNGGSKTLNHVDDYSPPWVIRVGGGVPSSNLWTRTFDVVGDQEKMVATNDSISEYRRGAGTSVAAPDVAGYYLQMLWSARQMVGDSNGRDDGALARAGDGAVRPSHGPLSDGVLTAIELERLMLMTAQHTDPSLPAGAFWPPFAYFWEGYGLVNESAVMDAEGVLAGKADAPSKGWADYWHSYDQYVRNATGATINRCQNEAYSELGSPAAAFVGCVEASGWRPTQGVPDVLWPWTG